MVPRCPTCGEVTDLLDGGRFLCGCNSSRLQRMWFRLKSRWSQWKARPETTPDYWDDDCFLDLLPDED